MNIRTILTTAALILALIAVLQATATARSCGGDDICVNTTGWWRDGGAFYASETPIRAAVDDATAGEVISVAAGSYRENVEIATAHLTLRGAGAGVVTVTAASSLEHVFRVTADYVNISGFTVTGAKDSGIYLGGADHCNISRNNVSNNHIGIHLQSSSNNTLTCNTANSNRRDGIYLTSSSNNTLQNNTANSNQVHSDGIELHNSNNNTLRDNTASHNYEDGIRLLTSSNNVLTDNTVLHNYYVGIYLRSSSNNTLTGNTANSNICDGMCLSSSSNNTIANNIVSNNGKSHADGCGIRMSSSSGNRVYNNYFNNTNNVYDHANNQWNTTRTNRTNIIGGPFLGGNYWSDYAGADTDNNGLGDTLLPYNSSGGIQNSGDLHPLTIPPAAPINCDCGDICVNTAGWWRDGGAFYASETPIRAAVDNATVGEVISVAAGSYSENVKIATSHLTLRGAGAGVVTVAAASSLDHVFGVTADYVNISGFTVTGAKDAGIYLGGADNCNISRNNASNNHVGIHLRYSSNNTLTCNTADSNRRDGIYLSSSSNNTLRNNTANSNQVHSDGIELYNSNNNTLLDNIASHNYEDGIRLRSSNNNVLANNTVVYNYYDGIYLSSSSSNTLLDNNASWNRCYGGIELFYSSNNTIANNTVSNNGKSCTDGCGIRLHSSSGNIVYNNYFSNTNNAYDDGNNSWNIIKTPGKNIIGGPHLGGNYWSDYVGVDSDGDGLGDSQYPIADGDNVDRHPLCYVKLGTNNSSTPADAAIALHLAVRGKYDPASDVNGDNRVTALDALMILQAARGAISV